MHVYVMDRQTDKPVIYTSEILKVLKSKTMKFEVKSEGLKHVSTGCNSDSVIG